MTTGREYEMVHQTKEDIARQIGDVFGPYYKENGMHVMEYGTTKFKYLTIDDLLVDWYQTIKQQHEDEEGAPGANWEEEIRFIETHYKEALEAS